MKKKYGKYFSIINWIFLIKKIWRKIYKIEKLTTPYNKSWWKNLNWINLKVKGLKWTKTKLKDWNEIWRNLEGQFCNLSKILLICTILQVGNALLDFTIDFNSADEYKWSHGLISDDDYQFLTKSCNGSAEIIRKALNQEADTKCLVVYVRVNQQLAKTIDPYDVTGDVCLSTVKSQTDMLYEPLLSKFQTLLPLHSKPKALNQQVNFFAHPCRNSYILWLVFIRFLYFKMGQTQIPFL